ncbi:metal-dependent hydrolase [Methanolobus halotolerans]|uniref:Metal-dependent hydrolase n=1 Tax=Methanolobus halotolerans TaxID=2052935 RepID=A0A4E0PVQ8_9EURY|nr:metal-dependent hydrolase [Methanolobus halotolerans]TGC08311.1 metal-dependent hydrolase [Methanolobus halotolerans]
MLIFGHIGITLGIFFMLGSLFPGIKPHIDYRYVAFGSLLPDLIDKPIGRVILAESVANGRIIAHTLVFCILLFLLGYYFYQSRGDARVIIIAGASFCHLLEDQMWTEPTTFFWPMFGWSFPYKASYGSSIDYSLEMLSRSLSADFFQFFSLELIGFIVILLIIVISLWKK